MTLESYELKEQPFEATPEPRFLYMSGTHRQAHASLLQALQAGRSFITLLAQPGLGKTTLLFHTLRSFGDNVATVYIPQATQTPCDLLRAILNGLGIRNIKEDQNVDEMYTQVREALLNKHRLGKRVIVVIDEAQNLNTSAFDLFCALSNMESGSASLIQFILGGQPSLSNKLAASKPLQLHMLQRSVPIARLEPLTAQETGRYVDHRLRTAGYTRQSPLFTPEALALLARYSQGNPRIINSLCSEALKVERPQIGADTVRQAAVTLGLEKSKQENTFAKPVAVAAAPQEATPVIPQPVQPLQPPAPPLSAGPVTVLPLRPAPRPETKSREKIAASAPPSPGPTAPRVPEKVETTPAKSMLAPVPQPAPAFRPEPTPPQVQPPSIPQLIPGSRAVPPPPSTFRSEPPPPPVQQQSVPQPAPGLHPVPQPAASTRKAPPAQPVPSIAPRPSVVTRQPSVTAPSLLPNHSLTKHSLVSRSYSAFVTAAVLLIGITGAAMGIFRTRSLHRPTAQSASAALLPHSPVLAVQQRHTDAGIITQPKGASSVTPLDKQASFDQSSSQHDLKGMDLASALRALSTEPQRRKPVQQRKTH